MVGSECVRVNYWGGLHVEVIVIVVGGGVGVTICVYLG